MIAAVDIGGTKIAVGIVDDDGRVLARQQTPTSADLGYSRAFDRTSDLLRQVAHTTGAEITGIGIGSTGPVDPFSGEIGDVNFLPGWQGSRIVADLKRLFRVRVAMENDADAAALGEAGWGAGRNKTRLIYITVGTGIGGGIILDGALYRGVDHAHPEIGHHVIDASGPACMCGFHGCWESLASGPAMVAWMKTEAPAEYPHRENLAAQRICGLALAGDKLARRAVDREAYYLGLGLANLVVLFTPDAIVLGGSVMKSANLFLEG
ncbi:MAG TPA: ROK family protein, partial [Terriglobales bacterium]|nr:ROK family protein [Terriglobales bacterium]